MGRRQGLSPSPTLSAFGDEDGGGEEDDEEGGGGDGACRLLQEEGNVPGDPVMVVGYTLVTRSKAQTFRILNAELRWVRVLGCVCMQHGEVDPSRSPTPQPHMTPK